MQQGGCGENLDQLHHTVSSSVATWLTFKREGRIGIAAPLGAVGDWKETEGGVLFLDQEAGYLSGL